jgi:hypothetical protein
LSGRRINAFSTLKTIALAPIARARVSTAVEANPGAFRNCRKASRISAFMLPLVTHRQVFSSGSGACIGCTQVPGRRFHRRLAIPGSSVELQDKPRPPLVSYPFFLIFLSIPLDATLGLYWRVRKNKENSRKLPVRLRQAIRMPCRNRLPVPVFTWSWRPEGDKMLK